MFWNKKEEKIELPELPPLKDLKLEDDEEMPIEKQSLPSFPDSPIRKGFSQAAIKDAITNKEEKKERIMELEEWTPSLPSDINTKIAYNRSEELPQHAPIREKVAVVRNTDIFVKLEKFQSARKALEDARAKLEEMDEILKRIRETKLREEQELTSWEREMTSIKTRIEEVNQNIFGKID